MKTRFLLCACALMLGLAIVGFADSAADQYDLLMKPAIAANMALQKNVATDLAATAMNATDLQAAFAKIEAYWAMKNVADAQMFAKNIQQAAADVHTAAVAGNKDDAAAAAKKIGANCGGCHMAHRNREADGSYTIK